MQKRIANPRLLLALCCVLLLRPCACPAAAEPKTPIVYFTDLFHPAVDPDDHFDLATLFALQEFDIQAVILDNHHATRPDKDQGDASGRPALEQMMHLTGRKVPSAACWTCSAVRRRRSS